MLKKLLQLTLITLIIFSIAHLIRTARITYQTYAPALETPEMIMNYNDRGISLYDRHDRLFFTFYDAKLRQIVPLEDVSPYAKQAIISIEDNRFYDHEGFSLRGITRSALVNIQERRIISGGSTITQQLVKNSLLTPQKDFLRKFQELVLALAIEYRYSKDEILEMYLNSIYFGQGSFGIEQAALTYFNVPAQELTLSQASLLAALLPAPSHLSAPAPESFYDVRQRQRLVLQAMFNQGHITLEEANEAMQEPVTLANTTREANINAPHFALLVRDTLIDMYGEQEVARSGFKVKTTLDIDLHNSVQSIVQRHEGSMRAQGASSAAAVVIDPGTGHVLSLVGSPDWNEERVGKINMATSPRQTGSSFKTFVYAAALEQRAITPASILQDTPRTFGRDYTPRNYDGSFRGPVSVRQALVQSLNIPAVEVVSRIGVPSAIRTINKAGITTITPESDIGYSLALGAGEVSLLEMTGGYALFANNGTLQPPIVIQEIMDKADDVVYSSDTVKPVYVISPQTAYLISSILADNATREAVFSRNLTLSRPAAVKTGTSQRFRDGWTIGYTPTMAVGVWVGNPNNAPTHNTPGLLSAGPIWKDVIERATANTPPLAFERPDRIIASTVCRGYRMTEEVFIQGTEIHRPCPPRPTPSPEESDEEAPEEEESQIAEEAPEQGTVERRVPGAIPPAHAAAEAH